MIVISIINKKRIIICRLQGIKIECFLSKHNMCIEFQLLEFHIVPIKKTFIILYVSSQFFLYIYARAICYIILYTNNYSFLFTAL